MEKEVFWSLEFLKLYEERDLKRMRERLFKITDIFVYLHEILAEKEIILEEKEIYSEQLVIKFHLHNLSLLNLSEGCLINSNFYSIKNPKVKLLDISSIMTIVRSQLETLLMYQHIYINSEDEEEQKLRFYSWILTPLIQRYSSYKNKNVEKYNEDSDSKSIDEIRKMILKLDSFKKLSEKQQIQLIEKGSGKLFKKWDKIFEESKFSKNGVLSKIYYFLSAYSHSEGLFAIQLKKTKHLYDDEQLQEKLHLMLFYSYIMTCVMITNIKKKYSDINERFITLEEKIKFEIDFNTQIAFKEIPEN